MNQIHQLRAIIVRTPQERRSMSRLRKKTEKAVEQLIAALDAMMADPDLEDGGDDEKTGDEEPDLGWALTTRQEGQNWWGDVFSDTDRELDDADKEPSLGAPERHPHYHWGLGGNYRDGTGSQTCWALGGSDDREDDGDDREPDYEL